MIPKTDVNIKKFYQLQLFVSNFKCRLQIDRRCYMDGCGPEWIAGLNAFLF